VSEDGALVASGTIYFTPTPDSAPTPKVTVSEVTGDSQPIRLQADDVYKELRLRGYEYGPTFRGIFSIDGNSKNIDDIIHCLKPVT